MADLMSVNVPFRFKRRDSKQWVVLKGFSAAEGIACCNDA